MEIFRGAKNTTRFLTPQKGVATYRQDSLQGTKKALTERFLGVPQNAYLLILDNRETIQIFFACKISALRVCFQVTNLKTKQERALIMLMQHKNIRNSAVCQEKNEFTAELERKADKRGRCEMLADSLNRLGYDGKAARVRDCGTQLAFAYLLEEKRRQLIHANFCRERLCPMCSEQRSKQIFAQVSQVMDVVEQERPELTPVFLTLTVRNCKAGELSATLDSIFQGWNRMITGTSKLHRVVAGWFRALEVTYNEAADTYHPHVHAILLVPKSYFKADSKDYMTTEKWVKAWRKAARLDYDPVCDIRAVKAKSRKKRDATVADGRAAAVAEVAKYTVKDVDYLKSDVELTDKLVKIFGAAIRGRRLYAFGGVMKEVAKRLKISAAGEGWEPDEVRDRNGVLLRKDIDYILLLYRWNIGLSRYECDGQI